MGKIKKATALAVAMCVLVTGCATPPAFVSAKEATPELNLRFESVECSRLAELLTIEEENEKQMSADMAGRATKQLALNALGVATLALGGYGMAWSVRGEGARRESLAISRGEIEVMKKVLAEKRCRPDGSTPDILIEVVRLAGGNAAIVDKSSPGKTFAEMGVASCDGVPADASAQDHLDQGRKLVATDQYPGAMRCLLRAMEMGKGTSVYRESCQAVSMLYDYGWGVQKNVETARLWKVKSNE
ncbi:MAG: hypothetical protein JNL19_01165 [Burkholderiales bacterium]|nr:hypothetical protein [Burkholderiales bacterium]